MYESVRQVHKMDYTVLDLEMTGLAPKRDKVIEIGAVRVRNGEIADTYGTLVRPGMSIPETVVQLTGITDEMAALGKEENVAMQELLQFIGDDILVGHNLTDQSGWPFRCSPMPALPIRLCRFFRH